MNTNVFAITKMCILFAVFFLLGYVNYFLPLEYPTYGWKQVKYIPILIFLYMFHNCYFLFISSNLLN